MLRQLHISNLAIIENVDIELTGGLNVFTGQTGAGKSLILGALELLLGLRDGGQAAASLVRPDCDEARVSGVFEIASPDLAARLGKVLDQSLTPDEPVLITRRLSAAGRSGVSVNGLPATAGMLRQAGQMLVDIHGQHDQQFLLKPANQLAILDAYADCRADRRKFAECLTELRRCRQKLADLRDSTEKRAEALELYRFQIDEIDAAACQPGEYEQARDRYNVLRNAAHLQELTGQLLAGLAEGDETVIEHLGVLQRAVREIVRLDAGMSSLSEQFDQAAELLGDAALALERYQDALDADPSELARVEQRLDALNRLIHKYARQAEPGANPIQAVLDFRVRVGKKVAELEADTQASGELEGKIARLEKDLAAVGKRLSGKRRKAAARIRPLVETQFRELEMAEASFEAHIESRAADDPAVDSSGLDEMEFLVRTNPGQEMQPLRRIASGGEISRIMLALKTILADKDQVTVLIFDEIDSNIGDRLGAAIGAKMRALAHGGRADGKDRPGCQIICITHLSQIAASADHHLHIRKEVVGRGDTRRTVAAVRTLTGEDRVRELAEMMAGANATDATRKHARNLLQPLARKGTKEPKRSERKKAQAAGACA